MDTLQAYEQFLQGLEKCKRDLLEAGADLARATQVCLDVCQQDDPSMRLAEHMSEAIQKVNRAADEIDDLAAGVKVEKGMIESL